MNEKGLTTDKFENSHEMEHFLEINGTHSRKKQKFQLDLQSYLKFEAGI